MVRVGFRGVSVATRESAPRERERERENEVTFDLYVIDQDYLFF